MARTAKIAVSLDAQRLLAAIAAKDRQRPPDGDGEILEQIVAIGLGPRVACRDPLDDRA